ncbi:yersiniabactin-iron transporter permease YbtX [Escherichia coli]|nr:yersiniabactin-iron transporter permease YbtX [Escherichia coli]
MRQSPFWQALSVAVVAQHFGYAACFLFAGAFTLLAAWVAYIRLHSARELMTSAID